MKKYIKKLSLLISVLFLLFSNCSIILAEDTSIDKYEEACCAKNWSTEGMFQCTINASKMWDKELNKYYNLLMKELSPKEKPDLRSAQLSWLTFRDKEYENIDNIYNKIQGTMYINISAGDKREVVKQRALQLKEYYENLIKSK